MKIEKRIHECCIVNKCFELKFAMVLYYVRDDYMPNNVDARCSIRNPHCIL